MGNSCAVTDCPDTVHQVEEMFEKQSGACLICGKPLVLGGKLPNSAKVDHNHRTGAVRGLLCDHCSRGLGYFLDNPAALEAAAQYLREGEDT